MHFQYDRKNKPQQILLLIALIGLLGLIGLVANRSQASSQPSKPVSAVATPTADQLKEADEVDEAVLSSKQEMYCYRLFAHITNEARQTKKIDKCVDKTSNWTVEDFDAQMPPDPLA
jgi:hypothetical protein